MLRLLLDHIGACRPERGARALARMGGFGSRQRGEMAGREVAPAEPPGAEAGGPMDLRHDVAASGGGPARELERLQVVADGERRRSATAQRARSISTRSASLRIAGSSSCSAAAAGWRLSASSSIDCRAMRAPSRPRRASAPGRCDRRPRSPPGAPGRSRRGSRATGSQRRRRAGRAALERQAVDAVGVRMVAIVLEPGAAAPRRSSGRRRGACSAAAARGRAAADRAGARSGRRRHPSAPRPAARRSRGRGAGRACSAAPGHGHARPGRTLDDSGRRGSPWSIPAARISNATDQLSTWPARAVQNA